MAKTGFQIRFPKPVFKTGFQNRFSNPIPKTGFQNRFSIPVFKTEKTGFADPNPPPIRRARNLRLFLLATGRTSTSMRQTTRARLPYTAGRLSQRPRTGPARRRRTRPAGHKFDFRGGIPLTVYGAVFATRVGHTNAVEQCLFVVLAGYLARTQYMKNYCLGERCSVL